MYKNHLTLIIHWDISPKHFQSCAQSSFTCVCVFLYSAFIISALLESSYIYLPHCLRSAKQNLMHDYKPNLISMQFTNGHAVAQDWNLYAKIFHHLECWFDHFSSLPIKALDMLEYGRPTQMLQPSFICCAWSNEEWGSVSVPYAQSPTKP